MPPPTGACCFPAGDCVVLTATHCELEGGAYAGDGVACADAKCFVPPPTGACCFRTGDCTELTATQCGLEGGAYAGDDVPCPPVGRP